LSLAKRRDGANSPRCDTNRGIWIASNDNIITSF
jgi:hypothetical protein